MNELNLRIAYEDLLGRYLAPLRRLAWAYVRDGGEDLFQEIAMALWTALPRFRGDSSERTWVYRIAHNTAISFVSSRRRRAQREIAEGAPYERRVWWRNAREYTACLVLLIWTSGGVRDGNPAAIMMAAAALGMIGVRWWAHRGNGSLDAGADAVTYQAALLKRYDDRIALMTCAKYWSAVPLYLPLTWLTWARWDLDPQRAAVVFASATAVFSLMLWLTDRFAVRKLKNARAEVAQLLNTEAVS